MVKEHPQTKVVTDTGYLTFLLLVLQLYVGFVLFLLLLVLRVNTRYLHPGSRSWACAPQSISLHSVLLGRMLSIGMYACIVLAPTKTNCSTHEPSTPF